MIFHDLRSPLGNIISSLAVMQSSISDKDEATLAVLSIASRSSRRASRLVESLLDLDRLESDKAVLTKEQASVGALIAEAVEEVHPTAEAKGQLLKMGIPAGLPLMEIDVDMIRRVLINLLDNAVKYSPGGGEIAISAKVKDGEMFVRVRDSGEGISAEDGEIIFDKFTRLDKQSKRKGLGLGLAFCRLAVEAHQGHIWVDSEKGKGSTFTFTLPV
jgi:signal transduction histidine kinase